MAEGKLRLTDSVAKWRPGLVPDSGRVSCQFPGSETSGMPRQACEASASTVCGGCTTTRRSRGSSVPGYRRDPEFHTKAGRELELYARVFEEKRPRPGESM